jgi:hypothetical protein
MGSFADLLQSAGYLRDDVVVGPVPDLEPPAPEELDRLYEEIAEEARVESDALLLEFAPLPSVRGARAWVQVAVWYDGDLTANERGRIARVLRRRFRVSRAPTAARPRSRRRPHDETASSSSGPSGSKRVAPVGS